MFRDWIYLVVGPSKLPNHGKFFDFCIQRGFTLHKLDTGADGIDCNEFLFAKDGFVNPETRLHLTQTHIQPSEYQKLS